MARPIGCFEGGSNTRMMLKGERNERAAEEPLQRAAGDELREVGPQKAQSSEKMRKPVALNQQVARMEKVAP